MPTVNPNYMTKNQKQNELFLRREDDISNVYTNLSSVQLNQNIVSNNSIPRIIFKNRNWYAETNMTESRKTRYKLPKKLLEKEKPIPFIDSLHENYGRYNKN